MVEDTNSDETTDGEQEVEPEAEPVTPAGEDDGDSIVDLAQQPIVVDWIKYVAGLFAFLAIGMGLFTLLLDVVDPDTFGISGGGGDVADMIVGELFFLIPVLAITIAVFLGAFLGWKLETDDTTTFLAAGLSALVGLIVFWLLSTILGTVFSDFSLEFGDLLINSIAAGIAAAVTAVGGAWTSRNLAPTTLDSSTNVSTESGVAPADD